MWRWPLWDLFQFSAYLDRKMPRRRFPWRVHTTRRRVQTGDLIKGCSPSKEEVPKTIAPSQRGPSQAGIERFSDEISARNDFRNQLFCYVEIRYCREFPWSTESIGESRRRPHAVMASQLQGSARQDADFSRAEYRQKTRYFVKVESNSQAAEDFAIVRGLCGSFILRSLHAPPFVGWRAPATTSR